MARGGAQQLGQGQRRGAGGHPGREPAEVDRDAPVGEVAVGEQRQDEGGALTQVPEETVVGALLGRVDRHPEALAEVEEGAEHPLGLEPLGDRDDGREVTLRPGAGEVPVPHVAEEEDDGASRGQVSPSRTVADEPDRGREGRRGERGQPEHRPPVAQVAADTLGDQVGKAPTKEQCVKDANSYYYETVDGIEQGAFCLDYDWVVGGCMDFAAEDPKHIPCTQRTSKGVKVVAIQPDKTSVDDCPTDGGYVYDQRKFAVCTEDLPK